jgi:hypothetical protein
VPYSAVRGKKSRSRQALDELKQQIPLLDYLQLMIGIRPDVSAVVD